MQDYILMMSLVQASGIITYNAYYMIILSYEDNNLKKCSLYVIYISAQKEKHSFNTSA